MRTTLCPAFTISKLRGFFPLLEKCCEDMINYIEDNSNFGNELLQLYHIKTSSNISSVNTTPKIYYEFF